MKRKKKFVAIVMGVLIGTMSCMTVMASSMCQNEGCVYMSDMYSVLDHYSLDSGTFRPCEHGKYGYDSLCTHMEVREYYCSNGCPPWTDDVSVGVYWRCDGN